MESPYPEVKNSALDDIPSISSSLADFSGDDLQNVIDNLSKEKTPFTGPCVKLNIEILLKLARKCFDTTLDEMVLEHGELHTLNEVSSFK